MRKLFIAFWILIVIFSFASCVNDGGDPADENTAEIVENLKPAQLINTALEEADGITVTYELLPSSSSSRALSDGACTLKATSVFSDYRYSNVAVKTGTLEYTFPGNLSGNAFTATSVSVKTIDAIVAEIAGEESKIEISIEDTETSFSAAVAGTAIAVTAPLEVDESSIAVKVDVSDAPAVQDPPQELIDAINSIFSSINGMKSQTIKSTGYDKDGNVIIEQTSEFNSAGADISIRIGSIGSSYSYLKPNTAANVKVNGEELVIEIGGESYTGEDAKAAYQEISMVQQSAVKADESASITYSTTLGQDLNCTLESTTIGSDTNIITHYTLSSYYEGISEFRIETTGRISGSTLIDDESICYIESGSYAGAYHWEYTEQPIM